ncbi:hypothetical protein BC833DRAFT_591394 [Globomyces pollinis-pini]|nr:hypothetical protein BC833DRAFT_591394 [Globomyces pollinis-pini]
MKAECPELDPDSAWLIEQQMRQENISIDSGNMILDQEMMLDPDYSFEMEQTQVCPVCQTHSMTLSIDTISCSNCKMSIKVTIKKLIFRQM